MLDCLLISTYIIKDMIIIDRSKKLKSEPFVWKQMFEVSTKCLRDFIKSGSVSTCGLKSKLVDFKS